MSNPSQYGPPSQQSGGGGTSVLMIVLIVLGVLVVMCAGLCGGCYLVVRRAGTEIGKGLEEGIKYVQLTPAYVEAQQAVASHQPVIDRLGEPIEPSGDAAPFRHEGKGALNKSGETIQFDVKGPKGTGIVSVVATAGDDAIFHPAKITVTFSDGAVVDVPVAAANPATPP